MKCSYKDQRAILRDFVRSSGSYLTEEEFDNEYQKDDGIVICTLKHDVDQLSGRLMWKESEPGQVLARILRVWGMAVILQIRRLEKYYRCQW